MSGEPGTEAPDTSRPHGLWRLKNRETRLLIYLFVAAAVAGYWLLPRPWTPARTVETQQHVIYSTASEVQTHSVANALDALYASYSNVFSSLPQFDSSHQKLKLKLFRDRAEFRRVHPNVGWAEAFYRFPYCRAYFDAGKPNPHHWIIHESVHQLNREVAHLKLEKWLEEGLATYFSSSHLEPTNTSRARIDFETYPAWWLFELATETSLQDNLKNGSVIPLKVIVQNEGGPDLDQHFNLYYLHWWTLTHFVFQDPRYRSRAVELVRTGGDLESFERILGPVEQVQSQWHAHVHGIKVSFGREHLEKLRFKSRPVLTNNSR